MFRIPILAAVAALMLGTGPAFAANFDVQMLNKGDAGAMVFEPSLVQLAAGDTVTFVAVDKGHNAEAVKELIPDGAEPFKGKINEEITIAFDVPGVYVIKCQPHLAMGMVMAVVVGEATANLEAVKTAKFPKKARERLDAALAAGGY